MVCDSITQMASLFSSTNVIAVVVLTIYCVIQVYVLCRKYSCIDRQIFLYNYNVEVICDVELLIKRPHRQCCHWWRRRPHIKQLKSRKLVWVPAHCQCWTIEVGVMVFSSFLVTNINLWTIIYIIYFLYIPNQNIVKFVANVVKTKL